ncbi:serine endopeptidase [Herbaspirillum frisingense GSF30]|uniref:Serine endopeptidase n=2 Tax=Herbaspirillum frisingense TaxID=92645 RepID=A0AAI9IDB1_9BURK|nr:serine endopeptidase [Herbaspirillum frisingense GSF30]
MNIKKNAGRARARAAAPVFRRHQLYCAVLMTLAPALVLPASAQSFVHYDATRSNDRDAAAASWAAADEFKSDWGLGAMNAQQAYAAGLSGRGIKLGAVDSGLSLTHQEFAKRNVKALIVSGIYANDGFQMSGGRQAWRAGDAFNTTGAKSSRNDNHGSHVSGSIAAARNGVGMMGVAFESDYHITNSNGTDASVYGINMDYNYFRAAYGNLANAGVRVINSSWGNPDARDDVNTVAGVYAAHLRVMGSDKKSWLQAAADVARETNVLHVWAAGNSGRDNVNVRSALPYFQPDLEQNWLTVTALTKELVQPSFSNRCGLAKYWCVSAPGAAINSLGAKSDSAYDSENGTSMAAPHVTGALGLLMERYPTLDNQAIRTILLTTAKHLGKGAADAPNELFGWGIPDLGKALNGPAQLLGRFNAHLPAGAEDTWSNHISEAALVQRKSEERQKLADWRAIPVATLQAAVQEASREPLMRIGEQMKSSYDVSLKRVQTLRQLEVKVKADSSDELLDAYTAAAEAVSGDTIASTIMTLMKTGENPSTDKVIATLLAAEPSVKLARGPLDAYEAQSAYLNHVAKKTDTDYVGVLVKTGAGSLTLTGDNRYSGGTLLQGGTLGVGSNTALGSGSLSMSDGTTLRAAADGLALANALSLSGTGNIDTQAYNMTLSGAISDGASAGTRSARSCRPSLTHHDRRHCCSTSCTGAGPTDPGAVHQGYG